MPTMRTAPHTNRCLTAECRSAGHPSQKPKRGIEKANSCRSCGIDALKRLREFSRRFRERIAELFRQTLDGPAHPTQGRTDPRRVANGKGAVIVAGCPPLSVRFAPWEWHEDI